MKNKSKEKCSICKHPLERFEGDYTVELEGKPAHISCVVKKKRELEGR